MVQEEQEHHRSKLSMESNNQEQPVGWVIHEIDGEYGSSTACSKYLIMAIKRKQRVNEIKIQNARVLAKMCGKNKWLWVDSGSPITIFSLPEVIRAMGRANIHLIPERNEFLG